MKLSYTEESFVAEYLKDGNGTRAYLAIKPNSSERAAAVSANRLLKKPVILPLSQALDKMRLYSEPMKVGV